MTKYRIKKNTGLFSSGFIIEKYVYHPEGPDDWNGLSTYLPFWSWEPCTQYDLPDIDNKLNDN